VNTATVNLFVLITPAMTDILSDCSVMRLVHSTCFDLWIRPG